MEKQSATSVSTELIMPVGYGSWSGYWRDHGTPWRIEPEISQERQQFLRERMLVKPDIQSSTFPFKDIRLSRAEVEWMLVLIETSRQGASGVESGDVAGLDLRGANLSGANLSGLPLARLRGGIGQAEWKGTTAEQREAAAVKLSNANLSYANLEGAILRRAHMEGSNLEGSHLQGASLYRAHLEGARLSNAHLQGADLRSAYFSADCSVRGAVLYDDKHGGARLADVRWGDINLAVLDWSVHRGLRVEAITLGDDLVARKGKVDANAPTRLSLLRAAVRANRQLATALRNRGLNEDADRFAYRARALQRRVLAAQHLWLSMCAWELLDLISGHGYRPLRSFLTYVIVVIGFAMSYYFLAPASNVHFDLLGAVVFSVTSFHGRGFSPGEAVGLTNLVTVLAAGEALLGLLIEIVFIATFTQRLFSR